MEVTEEERQNLEPVHDEPISVVKVLEEAKVIAREYDKKLPPGVDYIDSLYRQYQLRAA